MSSLVAEKLFNDPEILDAEGTILRRVQEIQKAIDGPRGPQAERIQGYQETLEAFKAARGAALFYPYISSGIGKGPLVELLDGSVKYDFISGIGVHHFGHSHPKVLRTAIHASLGDTVMQGNLQQGESSLRFCQKLLKAATSSGAKLEHCFLSSTGVMGGENALKIAFQKREPADRVLAFSKCFAGRTLALSQVTDKEAYRVGLPKLMKVDYIPFYEEHNPSWSTKRAINTLREYILQYPGQYAGMIFELVQGEGGYYPGSTAFHRQLMELCRENQIPVLVDEVQTFARTTRLFAFQHFELDDLVDIVWIGKASQVCATLFRGDFNPKPGLLSQTFTASTTAIAVGELLLDQLLEGDYFGQEGRIEKLHGYFRTELEALNKKHPDLIQGPYGLGSMIAFTALGGDADKSMHFIKKLFENGVLSFIAGSEPTRIRFLIPILATQKEDIVAASRIIEKTLLEVHACQNS